MMKKKVLSLFLAFSLMLSLSIPAFAHDNTSVSEFPLLLNSETAIINGITTTINTYNDQGFIVVTYTFSDENITQKAMDATIDIIESEIVSSQPFAQVASGPTPSKSKSFNTSAKAPSNIRLEASQAGTIYHSNQDYAYLWIEGGHSSAAYTDPDYTPDSVWITERFETTGIVLTASWPPSVSTGSKIYERTLGPYQNVNFHTVYWPTISATSVAGTGFSLTATTIVDAYLAGDHATYSAQTSYKQNFQYGW